MRLFQLPLMDLGTQYISYNHFHTIILLKQITTILAQIRVSLWNKKSKFNRLLFTIVDHWSNFIFYLFRLKVNCGAKKHFVLNGHPSPPRKWNIQITNSIQIYYKSKLETESVFDHASRVLKLDCSYLTIFVNIICALIIQFLAVIIGNGNIMKPDYA